MVLSRSAPNCFHISLAAHASLGMVVSRKNGSSFLDLDVPNAMALSSRRLPRKHQGQMTSEITSIEIAHGLRHRVVASKPGRAASPAADGFHRAPIARPHHRRDDIEPATSNRPALAPPRRILRRPWPSARRRWPRPRRVGNAGIVARALDGSAFERIEFLLIAGRQRVEPCAKVMS